MGVNVAGGVEVGGNSIDVDEAPTVDMTRGKKVGGTVAGDGIASCACKGAPGTKCVTASAIAPPKNSIALTYSTL